MTLTPRGTRLNWMSEPGDLEQRLAYMNLGAEDLELLSALRPVLEKHADSLVAAFYRHLLSFPVTRRLLDDPVVKERLLEKQREYLLSLTGPRIDEAYLEERKRIGQVHERVGLGPRWYLGAYGLYLSLLTPLLCDVFANDLPRATATLVALQKRLLLDAQLAMEAYIERHERALENANRELATLGRQLERDYQEQGGELRRTAERARAAEELASVATLIAGLAHEIGTPMGVIQGHARMLESSVSDENDRWRLRTIQEQIGRITNIIQALLNIARPGKTARVAVALEPLLENTLSFLEEKFARRKIEVRRNFEPVPSVTGDAERLQQLFLNLLLNAADAMPDGGELSVLLRPTEAGEAEIRIADTGVGIPESDLPRIFEPFFTSKPAGKGNGLGLAVAKGIVSDHAGEIAVSSTVGKGTGFRVLLPLPSRAVGGA